MAVQFINVESFFSLRKFIGPKNPLWLPVLPILWFCAGAQKNMAAKFKGITIILIDGGKTIRFKAANNRQVKRMDSL